MFVKITKNYVKTLKIKEDRNVEADKAHKHDQNSFKGHERLR